MSPPAEFKSPVAVNATPLIAELVAVPLILISPPPVLICEKMATPEDPPVLRRPLIAKSPPLVFIFALTLTFPLPVVKSP